MAEGEAAKDSTYSPWELRTYEEIALFDGQGTSVRPYQATTTYYHRDSDSSQCAISSRNVLLTYDLLLCIRYDSVLERFDRRHANSNSISEGRIEGSGTASGDGLR